MKTWTTTSAGTPIFSYHFSAPQPRAKLLVLGGVHGDEPEGILACSGLLQRCLEAYDLPLDLTLIPIFNPDGAFAKSRLNIRGVDLNRNLPTKDWSPLARTPRYQPGPAPASEPETKALVEWLKLEKPDFIISLHSYDPMVNYNGNSKEYAEHLAQLINYKAVPDIGYETPGSLGTYAAVENGIPTITVEIQRNLAFAEIHRIHVPALYESFKFFAKSK